MRTKHSRRVRFEQLESRNMMAVLPGDYNFNGTVQANDYTIWKSNYGNVAGVSDILTGDGNGDGVVDAVDYTVWRNNLGKTFADVPTDPPKTITVRATTATTIDVSWEASAFATSYTVQRRLPDISGTFTTIATNVVGTSYSDTSLTDGEIHEYQIVAQNNGGASEPSQRGSARANRANITAFRPQQFQDPENPTNAPIYTPYAKHEVLEGDEDSATLGPGIRINGDDDDMSGTADRLESGNPSPLENDLIEVRVDRVPGQGNMILETGGDLFLYYTYDKATPIPFQTATRTQALDFVNDSVTVFVEWSAGGHGTDPLRLRRASDLLIFDTLNFHTFHSAVLAFGGDTQMPADPVPDPKNFGVFRTAIELYEQGYDVRMYNEENLEPAFNEVVNSINLQGYTQVAMYGYSHGGGAVYEMSELIEEAADPFNGTITELFTVTFTGYIDAIEHGGGGSETRRPKLSLFHLNQWQTFGFPQGAALSDPNDGDEPQDRSAPGMNHRKIDDDIPTLDLLKLRLRQKVLR